MKLLLIMILSTMLFSQNVYTRKDIKVVNGITLSEITNKPINGIQKVYYVSGNLQAEILFKNGKWNGISKVYYESGNLMANTLFKDGKKNGISKDYYESGELEIEILYKDDKAIKGTRYTREGKATNMTNAHFHNYGAEY